MSACTKNNTDSSNYAYYADHTGELVSKLYGRETLYKKGLSIYTAINKDLSDVLQRSLEDNLFRLARKYSFEGALFHVQSGEAALFLKSLKQGQGWSALAAIKDKKYPWKSTKKQLVAGERYYAMVVAVSRNVLNVSTGADLFKIKINRFTRKNNLIYGDFIIVGVKDNGMLRVENMPSIQSAGVILDNRSSDVLAISGGLSYELSRYNRALYADRKSVV